MIGIERTGISCGINMGLFRFTFIFTCFYKINFTLY